MGYREIIEDREKDNLFFASVCPRCGNLKNNSKYVSLYAKVKICEECGRDEGLREYFKCPLDYKKWYIISEKKY